MKVALYEMLESEGRYPYINEVTEYQEENKTYIRISDIREVDFEMIDDAFIIPKKVDALRASKVKSAAEFDEKIAKLLSITHQPEEELFVPKFGEPEKDSIDPTSDAEPGETKPFLDVTAPIEGEEEGSTAPETKDE